MYACMNVDFVSFFFHECLRKLARNDFITGVGTKYMLASVEHSIVASEMSPQR